MTEPPIGKVLADMEREIEQSSETGRRSTNRVRAAGTFISLTGMRIYK
jgi:hypothetical protein